MMQYSMPSYAEQIKFRPIMMTPERAEQLLANNHPRNRNMKKAKIAQMVADINEGNWKLTPEPIVVTDKGILINGEAEAERLARKLNGEKESGNFQRNERGCYFPQPGWNGGNGRYASDR